MTQKPAAPTEPRQIRIGKELYARAVERAATDGVTITRVINAALKDYLDGSDREESLDRLEARIAATLSRGAKDTRLLRNDLQILIAVQDTFMRMYLQHTPPVPDEAKESASVEASRRYGLMMEAIVDRVRNGSVPWAQVQEDAPVVDG
jgi:hypothetical protein